MLTYHNDLSVKSLYVERFAAHRAADEVIQGQGFENGRGCFVGCMLNSYNHDRFPVELGWPLWLAHLADKIFEGVSKSEAPQFGTDLLNAVAVGIDLEPVKNKFLTRILRRRLTSLDGNETPYAVQVSAAIVGVIAILADDKSDKLAARAAAWAASAAEPAARAAWVEAESASAAEAESASAAESAASAAWAASAAESAAESAARAAESAAESAAWAETAARAAAWAESAAGEWSEYQLQRDDLLTLIREIK